MLELYGRSRRASPRLKRISGVAFSENCSSYRAHHQHQKAVTQYNQVASSCKMALFPYKDQLTIRNFGEIYGEWRWFRARIHNGAGFRLCRDVMSKKFSRELLRKRRMLNF
nr:hypothetical protein CFP56_45967 [Quercus suber]